MEYYPESQILIISIKGKSYVYDKKKNKTIEEFLADIDIKTIKTCEQIKYLNCLLVMDKINKSYIDKLKDMIMKYMPHIIVYFNIIEYLMILDNNIKIYLNPLDKTNGYIEGYNKDREKLKIVYNIYNWEVIQ